MLPSATDYISGFILDKSISVQCPKRLEKAKILIANTCGLCPAVNTVPALTVGS